MSWYWILLIVVLFVVALGPLMLLFSKLNKIDPFILENKDIDKENLNEQEERSLMTVVILRPMFVPLWVEDRIIKKLFNKKK